MKTLYIYIVLAICFSCICFGQVGINTTTPNASLDIQSSNQVTPANTDGILIPKIDEYPLINPTVVQDGMLVFATGNGSVIKGFYYWNNATTSWVAVSGATIQRIDDLVDGKSDNDGTDNGSSIFLGVNVGINDDGTNNNNIGIGISALQENISGRNNVATAPYSLNSNTTGSSNIAYGLSALRLNTIGSANAAIGFRSLFSNVSGQSNIAIGSLALSDNVNGDDNVAIGNLAGNATNGNANVFIGFNSGSGSSSDTKSGSVFIGYRAGYNENTSNNLYIENSDSSSPLIYGEFDNDLLRINGVAEVVETTNASLKVKTSDSNNASISLFEGTDFGFELLYTGADDKLNLWSRNFSGNEAERMTWLKDGRVGINDNAPNASLDIEASNIANPRSPDGILIPRIDNFPTTNPTIAQNGMLVYLNTDSSFYHWHHATTAWRNLNGAEQINDLTDGKSDIDGSDNGSSIYLGVNAGNNDDASNNRNVGIGYNTLTSNTSGTTNTGVGYQSLFSNTIGVSNTAIGFQSMLSNTTGRENTALGELSFTSNTTGRDNTALGWSSMTSNTTGNRNIAVGWSSLFSNTLGSENTALGRNSLFSNTTGSSNTAVGNESLFSNTTSEFNTAVGWRSLRANDSGISNTAIGCQSLLENTTGSDNTALGRSSLLFNTIGNENTALGRSALRSNTIGDGNVGVGFSSLTSNSGGRFNTAVGWRSLSSNIVGLSNTGVGYESLRVNRGNENTALGRSSLQFNSIGNRNTALGHQSLSSNEFGSDNTAVGHLSFNAGRGGLNTSVGARSLENSVNGTNNTAVGYRALDISNGGSNNTAIGARSGSGIVSLSNTTAVGYNAVPIAPNQVRIGNNSVSLIGGSANWTVFSDSRLKTNIEENIIGLDFIKQLRPVSYNYDMDAIARYEKTPDSLRLKDAEVLKAKEIQTGFLAQEVETVAKAIGFDFHGVVRFGEDGLYGLNYAEFVVPLVKAMQEQQVIIEMQQKKLSALRKEIEEIKAFLRQD